MLVFPSVNVSMTRHLTFKGYIWTTFHAICLYFVKLHLLLSISSLTVLIGQNEAKIYMHHRVHVASKSTDEGV